MPRRYWHHECCNNSDALTSSETCRSCGESGTFAFWGHGMYEDMARYTRTYGLKSVGPHQPLVGAFLLPLRERCSHCRGQGIVGDEESYTHCLHCEGGGGVWTGTDEEILVAYQRILSEFPDAATSDEVAFGGWHPLPAIWAR